MSVKGASAPAAMYAFLAPHSCFTTPQYASAVITYHASLTGLILHAQGTSEAYNPGVTLIAPPPSMQVPLPVPLPPLRSRLLPCPSLAAGLHEAVLRTNFNLRRSWQLDYVIWLTYVRGRCDF